MALEHIVGDVNDYEFEIEGDLSKQLGARPMPFPGMDSKKHSTFFLFCISLLYVCMCTYVNTENKASLCELYMNGSCPRGANCPFRHVRGERTIVCKHWLRHLCKKGDDCEYLHEYDMTKMPICYFYQKFGECNNKDCQYLHIDAESLKIRDCLWYDRGFCKHGMYCVMFVCLHNYTVHVKLGLVANVPRYKFFYSPYLISAYSLACPPVTS